MMGERWSKRGEARPDPRAAKSRKHGAVGSPEIQLADLLAGRYHCGAKFSMRALQFRNCLVRLEYQAASPTAAAPAWRSESDLPRAGFRLASSYSRSALWPQSAN
jgi:hypothetical protein